MSKRKFENGDLVVVTEKISKHYRSQGIFPGMIGTVVTYNYGYGSTSTYTVKFQNGMTLNDYSTAFEKGIPKSSIETLQEQIEKAKEKIERTQAFILETQEKIDFMEEIGTEVFDPNEFKAYQTLTIIDNSNMSKLEKAKAIASLISGK
jgi:hypothetical protein